MTQTPGAADGRRVFVDKQSPDAYKALRATAETVRDVAAAAGLDRLLVELINIRVSQLNACAHCLSLHTRAALRAGETVQRLGVLPAWRDTEPFSSRERAALALAGGHHPPRRRRRAEHRLRRGTGRPVGRRDLRRDPGGDQHQRLQPGLRPEQAPGAQRFGDAVAVTVTAPRRARTRPPAQ
ncbi:hypothetical protein SUDANB176_07214 [Streptomyces sp. enrichment culture]